MYHTIYIDIVFMTNFLMDYMLLRLVGKFLHLDVKRFRCMISAVFGSFVSCLLLYVPFRIILPVAVLIHGGCAFFMAAFAFRLKKEGFLQNHPIYVSHCICSRWYLPGTGNRKTMTVKIFLLFYGRDLRRSLYLDLCGRFHPAGKKNIYPVILKYQGRVQQSYGFFDTGNLLIDPVNRQPVSIIKPELLEKSFPVS